MDIIRKLVIVAIIMILLTGCSSGSNYYGDYSENEREIIEEEYIYSLEDLEEKYADGWNSQCEDVFSSYEVLYYSDVAYRFDDYYSSFDTPMLNDIVGSADGEYYNDVNLQEAYDIGKQEALDNIFVDTDVLCYGEERFYRYDY